MTDRGVSIEPGTGEWLRRISPSKVAAILGVSRWESQYRLWHRMKGITAQEPAKDIFDVGHDFEPALAAMYRRRHPGWLLSPGEVQISHDEDRFGFPCTVTLDRRARRGSHRRVVEFKTARSLEEWGDDFTDDAPADYVAQVLAQMIFTGYTDRPGHLFVMGPFFKAHEYEIAINEEIAQAILERCRAFWDSLAGDTPPDLDDSVATYECVREQHPDIEDRVAVVDSQLALDALRSKVALEEIKRIERGNRTRLLDAMGNAKSAEALGVKVAGRSPHGSGSVSMTLQVKNLDRLIEATPSQEEYAS